MKKIIGPFIIICLLLFISLIFFLPKQKEKIETEKQTSKKEKSLPYYKAENEKRYQAYQEQYPNLSHSEIVTRVNIGLDQPFYSHTKKAPFQQTNQVYVSKYYYLEDSYIPQDLEPLETSYAKAGIFLVKEAKEQLERMMKAAKEEGYPLHVTSAYRSYSYQLNLYTQYAKKDGEETADTYSARAGFSEHQTGLVVDLDNGTLPFTSFEKTDSFQWMEENAASYGFILRFPKGKEAITGYQYESWHYRYVGKPLAKKIKASNLTFDEYFVRYLEEA